MVERRPRATLGRVLDDLGMTLLEVALGRVDPAAQVGAVVIHDPYDPPVYSPADLLLGVGMTGAEEAARTVRELGRAGAAGLVLKLPIEVDRELRRAVEETGVTVFGLTQGASWAQVATVLNSSLGLSDGSVATFSDVDDGEDLFALANAIAALVEAPVTIEDLGSRVLAFSAGQDGADLYRKNAVLGRQVPDDVTWQMKQAGLFDRIYASDRPLVIRAPDAGLGDEMLPRVALAIRAGSEILGTIWAILPGPLTPEREQTLVDVSRPVALSMLRSRFALRGEDRVRTGLVSTLVGGGPAARDAAARHGHVSGPSCVVAVALREGDHDAAGTAAEMQRLASAFTLHLSVMHPHAVAALLGTVVYGVLPLTTGAGDPPETAAVASSREFLRRIGTRTSAVVGVGSLAQGAVHLAASRDDADRALRVVRAGSGRSPEARVAHIDDVQVESLLQQLGDIVVAENRTVSGPVARLAAYDDAHQSDLLVTLRAWLDAFGDVATAAEALHVHPNTLRYRLRRLAQVGRLDLADPDARFALMLQLRVFGA